MNLHDEETRVTNEKTGAQKGKKLTQLGSMDPVALIALARVAGMGADKYEAFNYLKGADWSLMFNALERHALLFWSGETYDEESGLPHMAHVAWLALALVSYSERNVGDDDRFVQEAPHPRQDPVEYTDPLRHGRRPPALSQYTMAQRIDKGEPHDTRRPEYPTEAYWVVRDPA